MKTKRTFCDPYFRYQICLKILICLFNQKKSNMNNLFRSLIAGYGAKKLGGGCFSTILIFVLIYWALGTCNKQTNTINTPQRTGQVNSHVFVKKA